MESAISSYFYQKLFDGNSGAGNPHSAAVASLAAANDPSSTASAFHQQYAAAIAQSVYQQQQNSNYPRAPYHPANGSSQTPFPLSHTSSSPQRRSLSPPETKRQRRQGLGKTTPSCDSDDENIPRVPDFGSGVVGSIPTSLVASPTETAIRVAGLSADLNQQITKFDSSEFDDDKEVVGNDAEGVWASDIEQSFQEAMSIYPPCGRRKIILSDEGKMYGRNELIARYIKLRTGKTRTRKQVSSHIQVLARRKLREIQAKIKVPGMTSSPSGGGSFHPFGNGGMTSNSNYHHEKALQSLQKMSSAQIVTASVTAAAALHANNHAAIMSKNFALPHATLANSPYGNSFWHPGIGNSNGSPDNGSTTSKYNGDNSPPDRQNSTSPIPTSYAMDRESSYRNVHHDTLVQQAAVAAQLAAAAAASQHHGGNITSLGVGGGHLDNSSTSSTSSSSNSSTGGGGGALLALNHHNPLLSAHHQQTTPPPSCQSETTPPLSSSSSETEQPTSLLLFPPGGGGGGKSTKGHNSPLAGSLESTDLQTVSNGGLWRCDGRAIATKRLRLRDFCAYVESSPVTHSIPSSSDQSQNKHIFVHIDGSNVSVNDPILEPVDIRQIQDKFPEKKGGLKDLYDKGPHDAFYLVKFWADLGSNISDESGAFYGVSTVYESTESISIQVSTKVCSFGKQVVEKLETEYGRLEKGRYVYRISRSPMCEYMINFIHKLKHLPEKYMMNSVLENFTILQVITNRDTQETLLCIAYVFEVSTSETHGAQHHIYRLVKD